MDLWEAAYNMDNFLCFFNKEEQELSTIKTPAGDNFLEKWKEVSSERVKILKSIVLLSLFFQIIF